MSDQPKKRRRTPYSCLSCRQRKVKCNRVRPVCNHCEKSKRVCEYDGPVMWSESGGKGEGTIPGDAIKGGAIQFVATLNSSERNESERSERSKRSDRIGTDGFKSDDKGNLYGLLALRERESMLRTTRNKEDLPIISGNFTPPIHTFSLVHTPDHFAKDGRLMCLGSFQKSVLWRRDPLVSAIMGRCFANHRKLQKVDDKEAVLRHTAGRGPASLERQVRLRKRTHKNSLRALSDPTGDDSCFLKSQMAAILPGERLLELHLARFFRIVHPFVPVLDERDFRDALNRILVPGVAHWELRTEKKTDLLTVATLLLVLRLSYSSIYIKNDATALVTGSDEEQLLQWPIEADVVNLVQLTLTASNFMRKTGVEKLQLLLLLRSYHTMAQEDGDGDGADGYLVIGLLCATGLSMGLNREIDCAVFESRGALCVTESPRRFQGLWKKLWALLRELDLDNAMQLGKKPTLRAEDDDNPQEPWTSATATTADLGVDRIAVEHNNALSLLYPVMHRLLTCLHDVKARASISDVMSDLAACERIRTLVFAKEGGPLTTELDKTRFVLAARWSLKIVTVEIIIHHYLLLHYEDKQQVNSFQKTLQKLVSLALNGLISGLRVLIRTGTELADYIITLVQPLVSCAHKCLQFFVSLGARILYFEFQLREVSGKDELPATLAKLMANLISVMKLCLKILAFTGDQYYLPYRLFARYNFIIELIENGGNFYGTETLALAEKPHAIESCSLKDIKLLNSTLEEFICSDAFRELSSADQIWKVNLSETSLSRRLGDGEGIVGGEGGLGEFAVEPLEEWLPKVDLFEEFGVFE